MPSSLVETMSWTPATLASMLIQAMEDYRREQGLRVAGLRKRKGWSQETLAQKAHVSSQTVSRFENGRHEGRSDTIQKLAKALGVNEHDIRGTPPDPFGLGNGGVRSETNPAFESVQTSLKALHDGQIAIVEHLQALQSAVTALADMARAANDIARRRI